MKNENDSLERLHQLSKTMPCDVNKPNDLKTALASCGMPLIQALDNNRIRFKREEDKALFYGLLAVTVDYVMDGKLKTAFKPVTSKH